MSIDRQYGFEHYGKEAPRFKPCWWIDSDGEIAIDPSEQTILYMCGNDLERMRAALHEWCTGQEMVT